jgi:RNA polymerase sigma-70 factor (ECF subfamily)
MTSTREATPEPSEPDLTRLLTLATRGDQQAWREIVALYAGRVFALAKSRIRRLDLAEEITQSVFFTVASKLGSGGYAEQGRFEPWLFRVAINRIRDEIRRQRRQAEPTDPDALQALPQRSAGEADPMAELLPALRLALADLAEADREVIELRHHAGLAFNQIAQMLQEPLGTVLARHHRALRKLKDVLEQSASAAGPGRRARAEDEP